MKRPTVASLKKVTPENLATLGPERLAHILAAVADSRPDLKRRLRMELAAEQGGDHLALEIDKRLAAFQTSRAKVSWRQRPSFIRDLDGLRDLITGRLAGLDLVRAQQRLWAFMALARPVGLRLRDREGDAAPVFDRAAADLGYMLRAGGDETASSFVEAVIADPLRWTSWSPAVLDGAPQAFATAALTLIKTPGDGPRLAAIIRRLADAAGDVEAYRGTYTAKELNTPQISAQVAQRLLAAGHVEAAGQALQAAAPGAGKPADFDWETAWIDYLQQSGQTDAAQAARWASFERTLSVDRMRAFTRQLSDFDDVEAECQAFAFAAKHADFELALRFLMDWPALPEAARLIQTRADDIKAKPEDAQAWAARLRIRQPAAAHTLLRKVATAAFRRRDFATCDRLTAEADGIAIDD